MYVVKRDGRQEAVHFDKITARLKKLSYGLSADHCDPVLVAQKVCAGVYKGVTTSQLDELAAETAAALTANHPDYACLAARIAVSNLHKNTKKSFSETDAYLFDAIEGKVVERPQHMLMRVSVGIHKDNIDAAIETYHLMSQRWFTHASPTLFNAGTPRPQLSSCFLICMKDDSIEGIYDTLKECAVISKSAGGIGVSVHNIRATGSYIRGTNGTSNADCWNCTQYEKLGKQKKVVKAQNLWFEILKSQIETGTPYMLYKDTCNRKSNQQNLGTIKSLNNRVTSIVTKNLNKIIDTNYYPVETARRSNMRHRPIGIGVQGLADTFILLGMSFDSPEAQQLNKDIFETMYYHALKASSELASEEGPYETYNGSPVSKGVLQPDMWGVTPSSRWDWGALRSMIATDGVRNSLLVAPMPTASTSQILGNNECFEPYTSNIYSRRVLSGEFVVVNKHLLHDLTETGLWSPSVKNQIIHDDGSVQKINTIPNELKLIYKTVWEIKQRTLVDMAVDRGCFIDQSQSLNIHMDQPNFGKLTSLHFHTWSKGLKTGMYYLRSRAAADAIKFTVDTAMLKEHSEAVPADVNTKMAEMVCSIANRDDCLACGS
ncbi:hypothetical protein Leryth_001545 [Lithospermum erythrorhizon]|nr:hypothetical protein Leryth_001545 [Lithospermum erythrorhizon]